MARVTAAEVKEIIETDSVLAIGPFIAAASNLVTWVASQDADAQLNASMLKEIERWLAAHFYAIRDQQYTSKSTEGSSGSFQGQTGMIFESTYYGQMAMAQDVTGALARRNKETKEGTRMRVGMTWLGLEPSEQPRL